MATLSSFTRMLKAASPAEVKEWMAVCKEVYEKNGAKVVSVAEAEAKLKTKRTSTSVGPSEWNVFVNATWREMAADKGVLFDADADDAEKAFRKAAAAVGVTYQGALKEASRRKENKEGMTPAEKAEKAEKKAAAAAKRTEKKAVTKPVEKKAAAKPVEEAEESASEAEEESASESASEAGEQTFEAEMASLDMVFKVINGKTYIVEEKGGEAYTHTKGDTSFGPRAGIYDAETGEIDFDA